MIEDVSKPTRAPSKKSLTALQKGLAFARERSVAVVARPVEASRAFGRRALRTPLPGGEWRGRGGAAAAAITNGGHHAEVDHPESQRHPAHHPLFGLAAGGRPRRPAREPHG